MRIAFHAPLKSPDHPVPSGDRAMARLLVRALQLAGHTVETVSQLRSFHKSPDAFPTLLAEAEAERSRLKHLWQAGQKPDLWLSYHVYYKSPDLLGPVLAREFDVPYVTAEASYAARRDRSGWQAEQQWVRDALSAAAVNLCFTARDRAGLAGLALEASFVALPPFIDVAPFDAEPDDAPARLVTVAMMRAGDKFESYRMLAAALARIADRRWTLAVIGDGPLKAEVQALFSGFAPGRIAWLGQKDQTEIAALLREGGIYVWPGTGEAYGIAYLEAQAAGLPVVAQATAGVPEAVVAGLLTPEGNVAAYADAVAALLDDPQEASRLGREARRIVRTERSLENAAAILDRMAQGLKETA